MRKCFPILMTVVLAAFVLATLPAAGAPPRPIYPNPPHLSTNVAADANLSWGPGDQELIVNGNFESGNLSGWSRVNVNGDTFINNGTFDPNSPDGPLPPLAGNFSTITDQTGPGSHVIYQDITIPAGTISAILSWSDRLRNFAGTFANTAPLQRFKVEIRATNNTPLALIFSTEPGDAPFSNVAKRRADITSFRGQRVRVTFTADQNLAPFNVHLDNISVLVKSPGTTYDVYFGTNSNPGVNEFLGNSTNTAWDLPPLQPLTTYFWRLVARQGTEQTPGTLWQFTTPRVGPVDHFAWSSVPSPQYAGRPFAATITARDAANYVVTNFSGSVALSAAAGTGARSHSLLGEGPHTAYASYDRSTVGYAFTPNSDILVTGVRHFSGEKISLWTDDSVLLASQIVSGAAGSWQVTPLASPIQLYNNRTYRLGIYSGALSTNFTRFDLSASFAHGTIHQSYEGLGDNFPSNPHPARWWFADLVYLAGSADPVVVTPVEASAFTNGAWTGNVTINTIGTDVFLRAEEGSALGNSHRFSVLPADGARITGISLDGANLLITFTTVPGKTYELERTDSLSGNSWTTVLSNLHANADVMQVTDTPAADKQFYRVRVLP
jgi:hypothetical protein